MVSLLDGRIFSLPIQILLVSILSHLQRKVPLQMGSTLASLCMHSQNRSLLLKVHFQLLLLAPNPGPRIYSIVTPMQKKIYLPATDNVAITKISYLEKRRIKTKKVELSIQDFLV